MSWDCGGISKEGGKASGGKIRFQEFLYEKCDLFMTLQHPMWHYRVQETAYMDLQPRNRSVLLGAVCGRIYICSTVDV